MKKPNFTQEELLYIEKLMDINASYGEARMAKLIELFIYADINKQETIKDCIASSVLEIGESQIITKSIRDKIEKWRKGLK